MRCDHTGDDREGHPSDQPRDGRPQRKPKTESKLAGAIRLWLADALPGLSALPGLAGQDDAPEWLIETLVQQAPRRWVVYEPMVLLATGSFGFQAVSSSASTSASASKGSWQALLAAVAPAQREDLWRALLEALSPGAGKSQAQKLTHLAVNEGIPLRVADAEASERPENILRSPTGLRALYGNFGPTAVNNDDTGPTDADFARAFWVSTRQNGLYQTWAPRWSMFSRGNIKEKARLLAWGRREEGKGRQRAGGGDGSTDRAWAVDLYAGIGYFVFSYAQCGLRVLGWELNPWSAEALRRGAQRNGWSVRVLHGASALARPTAAAVYDACTEAEADEMGEAGKHRRLAPHIVLFVEDNRHAARRIAELRAANDGQRGLRVLHVNCGLLPTSDDSWRTAWDAVVGGSPAVQTGEGWLHLHENVGVTDIERRRAEIQALVAGWAAETKETKELVGTLDTAVPHVELVKTFAPGVWHCVFDVCISMR